MWPRRGESAGTLPLALKLALFYPVGHLSVHARARSDRVSVAHAVGGGNRHWGTRAHALTRELHKRYKHRLKPFHDACGQRAIRSGALGVQGETMGTGEAGEAGVAGEKVGRGRGMAHCGVRHMAPFAGVGITRLREAQRRHQRRHSLYRQNTKKLSSAGRIFPSYKT
jgi:hypothetical protein